MAFKNQYDELKGIFLLTLLGVVSTVSAHIDCNGKPFHCVNSTHFMICVDLGSGQSSTVDNFVIPCPPTTACGQTNRFECEFIDPNDPLPILRTTDLTNEIEKNATAQLVETFGTTSLSDNNTTRIEPSNFDTVSLTTTSASIRGITPVISENTTSQTIFSKINDTKYSAAVSTVSTRLVTEPIHSNNVEYVTVKRIETIFPDNNTNYTKTIKSHSTETTKLNEYSQMGESFNKTTSDKATYTSNNTNVTGNNKLSLSNSSNETIVTNTDASVVVKSNESLPVASSVNTNNTEKVNLMMVPDILTYDMNNYTLNTESNLTESTSGNIVTKDSVLAQEISTTELPKMEQNVTPSGMSSSGNIFLLITQSILNNTLPLKFQEQININMAVTDSLFHRSANLTLDNSGITEKDMVSVTESIISTHGIEPMGANDTSTHNLEVHLKYIDKSTDQYLVARNRSSNDKLLSTKNVTEEIITTAKPIKQFAADFPTTHSDNTINSDMLTGKSMNLSTYINSVVLISENTTEKNIITNENVTSEIMIPEILAVETTENIIFPDSKNKSHKMIVIERDNLTTSEFTPTTIETTTGAFKNLPLLTTERNNYVTGTSNSTLSHEITQPKENNYTFVPTIDLTSVIIIVNIPTEPSIPEIFHTSNVFKPSNTNVRSGDDITSTTAKKLSKFNESHVLENTTNKNLLHNADVTLESKITEIGVDTTSNTVYSDIIVQSYNMTTPVYENSNQSEIIASTVLFPTSERVVANHLQNLPTFEITQNDFLEVLPEVNSIYSEMNNNSSAGVDLSNKTIPVTISTNGPPKEEFITSYFNNTTYANVSKGNVTLNVVSDLNNTFIYKENIRHTNVLDNTNTTSIMMTEVKAAIIKNNIESSYNKSEMNNIINEPDSLNLKSSEITSTVAITTPKALITTPLQNVSFITAVKNKPESLLSELTSIPVEIQKQASDYTVMSTTSSTNVIITSTEPMTPVIFVTNNIVETNKSNTWKIEKLSEVTSESSKIFTELEENMYTLSETTVSEITPLIKVNEPFRVNMSFDNNVKKNASTDLDTRSGQTLTTEPVFTMGQNEPETIIAGASRNIELQKNQSNYEHKPNTSSLKDINTTEHLLAISNNVYSIGDYKKKLEKLQTSPKAFYVTTEATTILLPELSALVPETNDIAQKNAATSNAAMPVNEMITQLPLAIFNNSTRAEENTLSLLNYTITNSTTITSNISINVYNNTFNNEKNDSEKNGEKIASSTQISNQYLSYATPSTTEILSTANIDLPHSQDYKNKINAFTQFYTTSDTTPTAVHSKNIDKKIEKSTLQSNNSLDTETNKTFSFSNLRNDFMKETNTSIIELLNTIITRKQKDNEQKFIQKLSNNTDNLLSKDSISSSTDGNSERGNSITSLNNFHTGGLETGIQKENVSSTPPTSSLKTLIKSRPISQNINLADVNTVLVPPLSETPLVTNITEKYFTVESHIINYTNGDSKVTKTFNNYPYTTISEETNKSNIDVINTDQSTNMNETSISFNTVPIKSTSSIKAQLAFSVEEAQTTEIPKNGIESFIENGLLEVSIQHDSNFRLEDKSVSLPPYVGIANKSPVKEVNNTFEDLIRNNELLSLNGTTENFYNKTEKSEKLQNKFYSEYQNMSTFGRTIREDNKQTVNASNNSVLGVNKNNINTVYTSVGLDHNVGNTRINIPKNNSGLVSSKVYILSAEIHSPEFTTLNVTSNNVVLENIPSTVSIIKENHGLDSLKLNAKRNLPTIREDYKYSINNSSKLEESITWQDIYQDAFINMTSNIRNNESSNISLKSNLDTISKYLHNETKFTVPPTAVLPSPLNFDITHSNNTDQTSYISSDNLWNTKERINITTNSSSEINLSSNMTGSEFNKLESLDLKSPTSVFLQVPENKMKINQNLQQRITAPPVNTQSNDRYEIEFKQNTASVYVKKSLTSLNGELFRLNTTTSIITASQINASTITKNSTFDCAHRLRGRYGDNNDCRKFFICNGRRKPIIGLCPVDTVFSAIKTQCTKNLSHCIRDNQFKCTTEGRFNDYLRENIYYICVKNRQDTFFRFKFQCQKGYYLNKTSIRCIVKPVRLSQSISSKDSISEKISKEIHNSKESFKCEKEGTFSDPKNQRKYYECTMNKKFEFRRRRKECDRDEIFHSDKKKCVDRDSYESG